MYDTVQRLRSLKKATAMTWMTETLHRDTVQSILIPYRSATNGEFIDYVHKLSIKKNWSSPWDILKRVYIL